MGRFHFLRRWLLVVGVHRGALTALGVDGGGQLDRVGGIGGGDVGAGGAFSFPPSLFTDCGGPFGVDGDLRC